MDGRLRPAVFVAPHRDETFAGSVRDCTVAADAVPLKSGHGLS